jgi:hypothetical protein
MCVYGEFKIKHRPSWSKDNKSTNETYFGKVSLNSIHPMVSTLMKFATTEFGVSAATHVIQLVFK